MDHATARRHTQERFSARGAPGADAAAFREHLSGCPQCRAFYDRYVQAVRTAASGDAHRPVGLESRRLMEETLARLGSPVARPRWFLPAVPAWGWVAGGAVAVLLVALLLPRMWPGRPDREVAVRGGAGSLPTVGLGVSGVDVEGGEYEAAAAEGVCLADALRFYVTAREERFDHCFVLGISGAAALHWYVPDAEEGESFLLPGGKRIGWMVPYEIGLSAEHAVGPLVVVALFSAGPLRLEDVEAAVGSALDAGAALDGTLGTTVAGRLGRGTEGAAVQLLVKECEGGAR